MFLKKREFLFRMGNLYDEIRRQAEAYVSSSRDEEPFKSALEKGRITEEDLYCIGARDAARVSSSWQEAQRGQDPMSEAAKTRGDMIAANLLRMSWEDLGERVTATWRKISASHNARVGRTSSEGLS